MQQLIRQGCVRFFEGAVKGRPTFRYLRELEASQWLQRDELERRQLAALRRLLFHAQATCPYFRQSWAALGLDPRGVATLADFERWPVLDRDLIRQHRLEMRSCHPGLQLLTKSTGGSSGTPLHFDLDLDSDARRMAAWHRGYSWAGAKPGTKQLYLWGAPTGSRPWWKRCKDQLYQLLYRRLVFNSFELSEERLPSLLRRLNRYRPDVIVAYTGPLVEFARMLSERQFVPNAPRSIIVGAEKLHPFQRDLIQEVFRAPVFETYGSREVMLIGAECERREGLHLTAEHLLVEILDDEGQPTPAGEEGNVVITDLFNYGMPFVRYANGDRAVAGWQTCSCGRGLPLLRQVVGRRLDVLHTVDGRRIPGEFFPHLLKDYPTVRRFQVIQDAVDRIELRVVPENCFTAEARTRLTNEIVQVLGGRVRFELLSVQDIPLTAAGKLQVVVNRCTAINQENVAR
jgi:phenylacetate-CoA ligase